MPSALAATRAYRIIRAPRITGEEPTLLPDGVVIDLNTNRLPPPPTPPAVPPPNPPYGFFNLNPLPGGDIDIMFAPDGRVLTPALSNDFIALWVRDTTADDPAVGTPQRYLNGEPSIIAVYLRTGVISANDADTTPDPVIPNWLQDPYSYFRDGRNAGK